MLKIGLFGNLGILCDVILGPILLIFNRLPTPTLGYHLKNIQIVPIKTVGSRGVTNKQTDRQTDKQTDKRLDKQTDQHTSEKFFFFASNKQTERGENSNLRSSMRRLIMAEI